MKDVILDTDLYNEIDDQFALAYILKSKDKIKLNAVTLAPFTKENFDPNSSIDKSYEVAKNIFCLCGEQDDPIIYKGARNYFKDAQGKLNEAVDKIIEIVNRNKLTYILSIGCITNIALAIKKCPSIIKKIKIVWLGTNFLFMENNDFNFRQDVEAVKFVLKKKCDITIIPTYPVSYSLMISKYELDARILNKNKLCNYFCQIFSDDFGKKINRRPIWDISVVAFLINPEWFKVMSVSTPKITKNNHFKLTKHRHKIKFVQCLDSTKIYDDLFNKIGGINGN